MMNSATGSALPGNPSSAATVDRRYWYVIAAWGALTLAGLSLLLGKRGYDDPYITFRYASNLLAGHGLVYNVGQRTLSTTAPLYAAILAVLGLLWSDLPSLGNATSVLALVLSSALLLALSWNHGHRAVGMIAALLLSLSPFMLMTLGAETCFYLMLILVGFYAYDRSRLSLAAVALALAAMVRPDGVLAIVALGIYHVLRRRPLPWTPLALYAGLLSICYGGLWLYFGSPLPVTLLVKQQQGQMAISTRFAAGFLEILRQRARQPLYWLPAALMIPGLVQVWKKAQYWAPLLIWTALYLSAYSLLGVSRYYWYYTPLVPAVVVLVAGGAGTALRWLAQKATTLRPLVVSATGLLLIALLAPSLASVAYLALNPDSRLDVYRRIGQWLAANTPPAATVGALEVGIIGYYARRPMIDFAGLVQPEVALHFAATSTYQDAAAWAIQNYRPDYVVLPRDSFSSLAHSPSFQVDYSPVREFTNGESLWLTLYRRSSTP
jgi:Gpi18-like mannosyltransferase